MSFDALDNYSFMRKTVSDNDYSMIVKSIIDLANNLLCKPNSVLHLFQNSVTSGSTFEHLSYPEERRHCVWMDGSTSLTGDSRERMGGPCGKRQRAQPHRIVSVCPMRGNTNDARKPPVLVFTPDLSFALSDPTQSSPSYVLSELFPCNATYTLQQHLCEEDSWHNCEVALTVSGQRQVRIPQLLTSAPVASISNVFQTTQVLVNVSSVPTHMPWHKRRCRI